MKAWHYLHPAYKKVLKATAATNKIFIGGDIVENVDAMHLLDIGCIEDSRMKNGELILWSSYEALIFHQEYEVIKSYITAEKDTGWMWSHDDVILNQIFSKKLKKQDFIKLIFSLLEEFEAYEIAFSLLLKYYFQDNQAAIKYMHMIEDVEGELPWNFERWASYLFPNEKFLYNGQFDLSHPLSICDVAQDIVEKNPKLAYSLLEQAEKKAERSRAHFQCAQTWIHCFNATEKAEKCMEKAAWTKEYFDICNCAEGWMGLLGMQRTKAENLLKRASNTVGEALHYISLASNWHNLFLENSKASLYLNKAENISEEYHEFYFCAESWQTLFNDEIRAKKCMFKAEKLLKKSSDDYCSHAAKWSKLNNKQEAWKWMEKASDLATTPEDWLECCHSWFSIFQLESECKKAIKYAKECLKELEDKEDKEEAELFLEFAEDFWLSSTKTAT